MRRLAFLPSVLALALALGAPSGSAGESRAAEDLVVFLDHVDEVVRREAARALLRIGFPAEDALAAAVREGREELAEAAGRLGRYFSLARLLAEGLGTERGPWLALDAVLEEVDPALKDDVLALGLDGPVKAREVTAARDRARAFVDTFVRDWNENYAIGSEEEKRYDALKQRLVETGAAALPHLLRVLEVDPRLTFRFTDPPPPGEVSARMQVRAIFGVSFLEAREALPHLLIQTRGPSLTASSNAGAAFAKLAELEDLAAGPFARPDLERMDAWWNEHRGEQRETRRRLEERFLQELRSLLAREVLVVAEAPKAGEIPIRLPPELVAPHHRQAWLADLLGLLSGVTPPSLEREIPAEKRLESVRAYAERLAHAR